MICWWVLDKRLLIFYPVLLSDQGSFVEPTQVQIHYRVRQLKVLAGFVVAVHNHVTTADVVLKESRFDGVVAPKRMLEIFHFQKALQSVLILFKVVQAARKASISIASQEGVFV